MTTPEDFDAHLDAWHEWQTTPWGRLRYTLATTNLTHHLPPHPNGGRDRADVDPAGRAVLDLAGADGGDAIPLARRGYRVTIVDFAPGMLAAAEQRAVEAGVEIRCVRADATNLPADIGDHDVVLCHNLLQYQQDPVPALKAAVNALRPGGVLSVMAINRHAVPLITAVRGTDPAAALAALDSAEARTETFGTTITLHTAEEITPILTNLGCRLVGHYGIRSVSDYIVDDARKHEPEFYADLERLELALTGRAPYQHTARIFQLVAIKTT